MIKIMSIVEKIWSFAAQIWVVLRKHSVEVGLFAATFVSLVLKKNDLIEQTHFTILFPLFITLAYCLNTLFERGRRQWIYRLCWLPMVPLVFYSGWELWSRSPQCHLTLGVLCPIAILLCRRKKENIDFVGDALAYLYAGALSLSLSSLVFGLMCAINFSVLYIFGWNIDRNMETITTYSAWAVYLLLCPTLFFVFLRHFFHAVKQNNKLFDIVLNYIITPAIAIYTTILYLYIFQIVWLGELPKGGVAYMVFGFTMVASVANAMQFFVSKQIYRWYYGKLSFIGFAPLVMFWVGVAHRVNEFGLTPSRVYLLVCGAIMTLTLLTFLSRRYGNYLFLFFSVFICFALMAYVPGLGAKEIALNSQYRAAVQLSGTLTADSKQATFVRLLSAIEYINTHNKELLKELKFKTVDEVIHVAPNEMRRALNTRKGEKQTNVIIHTNYNEGFEMAHLQQYRLFLKPAETKNKTAWYTFDGSTLTVYSSEQKVAEVDLPSVIDATLRTEGYSLNDLPSREVIDELTHQLQTIQTDSAFIKLNHMVIETTGHNNRIRNVVVEFVLVK